MLILYNRILDKLLQRDISSPYVVESGDGVWVVVVLGVAGVRMCIREVESEGLVVILSPIGDGF